MCAQDRGLRLGLVTVWGVVGSGESGALVQAPVLGSGELLDVRINDVDEVV